MVRRLAGRLAQSVVVLWAAFTVSFIILYLLPGDPVSVMLNPGGQSSYIDPEKEAALRAELGFDKPAHEQYLSRLGAAVRGDFGNSIQGGGDVTATIVNALPATLALAGTGVLLGAVIGVGFAVAATAPRAGRLRELLLSLPPLGIAIPTFWAGLMLLQVFSFRLGWFPAFGNRGWESLVLPAITLSMPTAAVIAQVLANSLAATWREPYVEIARAKGASRLHTHLRHVVRNASIPTLTMMGLIVGTSLAGSVVVETVFSRTGVGRLMQTAVADRDIPMVQGLVVFSAVVFVVVNILIDLLYPLIDPRIRVGARADG